MADKQSREVIGGGRRRGKTTELIKRASEEKLYILCANKNMASSLFNRAKDMGLAIPYPITKEDLPLDGSYIKELLVDEVEMFLQQILGRPVVGMSTSYELREMPSLDKPHNAFKNAHEDNKVREGMLAYKCMRCSSEMAVSKRKEVRMDGRSCFLCGGPIQQIYRKSSAGELTIDIDCSNALAGLKAIQREARKATQGIKELGEQQKKNKVLPLTTGLNPHSVVFDEMHSECIRCGSTNGEIIKIAEPPSPKGLRIRAVKCLDCGNTI